ncbi:MAG: PEP-CTERM sorting domain-containing protein [Phycisphaerae bacterium]
MTLNLQLHGGGNVQQVQAGHTYTLDIYGTLLGPTDSVQNIAMGFKSTQGTTPLTSTLSNAAFAPGTGWNDYGNAGTAKNPSFNGVGTDTDWGAANGSVNGWYFASQAPGTYITVGTVDGVANSVLFGTIQWTAPATLHYGSRVTITAIPELNTALTKGMYQYKIGSTIHSGIVDTASTVDTGTGVTFLVQDTYEFIVGSGTNDYTGLQTNVDLGAVGNHLHPNYTPKLPVTSGNQVKGQIVITGLDPAADRNVLLLWSTNGLAGMPGVQAVEPQWAGCGATAELVLPTGATTYTLSYCFESGPMSTVNLLTNFAVVPEPASLGILGLGVLGLLGKRRRK